MFKRVMKLVSGKRVVPSVPVGYEVRLPAEDSNEVEMPDVNDDRHGDVALFIRYRDARGTLSERRVVCKRYDLERGMLHAYCLEWRALRTFRADRIVEAVTIDDGEVLTAEAVLGFLRDTLPIRDERLYHIIVILVFVMRCDGRADPRELQVIDRAVERFRKEFGADAGIVSDGRRLARHLAPDDASFERSLRAVGKDFHRREMAGLTCSSLAELIEADGSLSSEEAQIAEAVLAAFADV